MAKRCGLAGGFLGRRTLTGDEGAVTVDIARTSNEGSGRGAGCFLQCCPIPFRWRVSAAFALRQCGHTPADPFWPDLPFAILAVMRLHRATEAPGAFQSDPRCQRANVISDDERECNPVVV